MCLFFIPQIFYFLFNIIKVQIKIISLLKFEFKQKRASNSQLFSSFSLIFLVRDYVLQMLLVLLELFQFRLFVSAIPESFYLRDAYLDRYIN